MKKLLALSLCITLSLQAGFDYRFFDIYYAWCAKQKDENAFNQIHGLDQHADDILKRIYLDQSDECGPRISKREFRVALLSWILQTQTVDPDFVLLSSCRKSITPMSSATSAHNPFLDKHFICRACEVGDIEVAQAALNNIAQRDKQRADALEMAYFPGQALNKILVQGSIPDESGGVIFIECVRILQLHSLCSFRSARTDP